MALPRAALLKCLDERTDPGGDRTVTMEAIVSAVDIDAPVVESHVGKLLASELVHRDPNGELRITITGRELLELGLEDGVVVAPLEQDGES